MKTKAALRRENYRLQVRLTQLEGDYETVTGRLRGTRSVLEDQLRKHEPYIPGSTGSSWAHQLRQAAHGSVGPMRLFCSGCGGLSWPCRTITDIARAIESLSGGDADIDLSRFEVRIAAKD